MERSAILKNIEWKSLIAGSLVAALVAAFFAIWAETDPRSLTRFSLEDGVIENLSAALYGLACVGFVIVVFRDSPPELGKRWWCYLFLLGWALLCFLLFGEEISWGQRIFDFSTPVSVEAANVQKEFNLHNLRGLEAFWYRLLSLFMLFTGVVFPVAALFERVQRLIQRLVFPVLPMAYSAFFVLSYVYGKYYYYRVPGDGATEVRELLMALGLAAFALHGAIRPQALFRIRC